MNNKYEQIDKFLKIWRDVALENPNIDFLDTNTSDIIYSYLFKQNVKKNDQTIDISNTCFSTWIDNFKNISNIDCFVSPNWPYFCQFKNLKSFNGDYLKVYIPLDGDHIKEGINIIFNFLAKNNISHASKVSKEIRFDDVVIRLISEQDVDKLLNFVKQNSYIQSGLIPPNPFAYNKDGIALACDGALSYNSTVSRFISLYINNKKIKQDLDNVGVSDFYNFLIAYYNNVFTEKNYQIVINDFNLKTDDEELNSIITNYKQVLALIIKSSSPDFNYSDYLEHFRECSSGTLNNNYIVTNDKENGNKFLEDLLLDVVQTMSLKYGKEVAINSINVYLSTGLSNRITRDNNLRFRVVNSELRVYLNNVLKQSNLSLNEYINLLEEKNTKQEVSILNNNNLLVSGLKSTYDKYEQLSGNGIDYIRSAVKRLAFKGDYSGFTRDNGIRESIMRYITKEDFIEWLKVQYGYAYVDDLSLEVMCNSFIDEVISMNKKIS